MTPSRQLELDFERLSLHTDERLSLHTSEQLSPHAGEQRRRLTDEQERAVARRTGSLLLAAGAGSGKTSVLVERFVRAVREDGVTPGRILAITFTERAAGELRERVRARMLELGDREAARETEAANVCTFHGFCARLLRSHPVQAGVEPGFEILEEGIATRLRTLAFSDALAGFMAGERQQAVDLVAAYGADSLRAMVLGTYAQMRSQGQVEPRLPSARFQTRMSLGLEQLRALEADRPGVDRGLEQTANPQDADIQADDGDREEVDAKAIRACELIGELLERFGAGYAQRKHARAALDFDDLELNARALLEAHAEVRDSWAERFQLLMVDEFQDSNPRQLQVLATLDRDNLFTVGDELQSIYGFRHADVGLFRERRERLLGDGASLALTRNFRSLPPILAAVERIFAERIGEHFTALTPALALTKEHKSKPIVELLLTDKRGWEGLPEQDDLAGLPEATLWRQAEARLLAGRIAELVASGEARAGEVVVLLRALGDLPVYESALRRCGLRTLAGVGGFWSHQQVGDLLAWLRALANPLDELALYSALASPLGSVSSDGLALVARTAREQGCGVWQALVEHSAALDELLPADDRERMGSFRELFAAERASAPLHPIFELLRRAISATGYDRHVLSLDWGERRLANVHKLIRMARRFEAQEGRDLRGFLDHVAHLEIALAGREAEAPVGDAQLDAVRLMSIHAAKGLEFPVVCVADLGREPNLRVPDLLVDGAGGRLGLRLQELGSAESVCGLAYEELRDERRAAQEGEEDRVLYVACTRAEQRLLLSGSVAFGRWPATRPGVAPIAWLAPALVPDAPKLATSDAPPTGGLTTDLGGGLTVRCVFHSSSNAERARDGDSLADPCPTFAPQIPDNASEARTGTGEPPDRAAEARAVAPAKPAPGPEALGPLVHQATPKPPVHAATPRRLPLSDPDATMSYTALAELERCGYRFYVERVLGIPENRSAARSVGDDGGIEARRRGTIVHRLLESIDFARPQPPSLEDVARMARQIGVDLGPSERQEIAALIVTALAAEPARLLGLARRARREHPFAFSLGVGEPLVTGVLDLLVEQPDGSSLIVDYKSDRLVGGEDLEQLVQRDYGFQRLLYALAAIEDGALEVQVVHWFLERPDKWVAVSFDAHERDALRGRLLDRIARVRGKGFSVSEAPHRGICLTCPARAGLCSWGETRTSSERSTTLESDG
ncbi:MAG TPA: UvrD-helicase domain-containing protein [Solirubrobacteraceae bacterium]|jgi:ATP-dependent helicase/nuclease subunit A|nr:UvrD-helicase domain-containing protein [Solirubrobacteraceae bacterium]